MSSQSESADQELAENGETGATGTIEGIDLTLTPLQYHYLSLLQRLIALQNSYQVDPDYETWMMNAINKAIYSTLRDSIEANIGEAAKELLRKAHQVN
ncbi:MAG: hypothetical protein ACE1ZZ_05510 [Dehalococcoidia bacterium]